VAGKPAVLIVDDEFGLAEMLRDVMRDNGYDVSLAINGRQALEVLGERDIDLVLTDMMMPVMDGAELVTAMRRDQYHRHTPIIIMTSLPRVDARLDGLVSAVLRKPFTPDLLLNTMTACLTGRGDHDDDPEHGTGR